jgi:hypothetical protein
MSIMIMSMMSIIITPMSIITSPKTTKIEIFEFALEKAEMTDHPVKLGSGAGRPTGVPRNSSGLAWLPPNVPSALTSFKHPEMANSV